MMFLVGRLEIWKKSVVVTMLCELLQCASLYHFGYEVQAAHWSVVCVGCALFLSLMRGFTMAVFHWLLKVPLSSDRLAIFVIDCIHVCSISFILSVPM